MTPIAMALVIPLIAVAPAVAAASTPLVEAAKAGDRSTVRSLLSRATVNTPEADGTTALHWAVRRDDAELVALLIGGGANVKVANRYGVTPLSLAATNGSAVMIDTLVKAGADPNAALMSGETVLMAAARAGNPIAVKALIAHGANVNAMERAQGQTALMWAAAENNAGAVRALAEGGADLDAQSSALNYPLFKWTLNGMVSTALPKGRWTALMFAARQNAIDAARALVEAGANLNARDGEGTTALVLAIINVHFDLAAMLIEKGADPNIADETGMAALYAAVDMHTLAPMLVRPAPKLVDRLAPIDIVKQLLARGANPNARLGEPILGRHHGAGDTSLGEGATPLMRAAKSNDLASMRLLIEYGADAAATQKDMTNALMMAAAGGGRNIAFDIKPFQVTDDTEQQAIELLLDGGADVNAFNANGMTAVHFAAQRGADAVITLLAERGAVLDIKNKQGRTPVDLSLGGAGGRRGRGEARVYEGTAKLLRELLGSSVSPTDSR